MTNARQLLEQRCDGLEPVDVVPSVPVAVDNEQHRRLDLGEAVDDRACAELRRGGRPHRAERRGREERGDGLGQVRHHRRRRGRPRPPRAAGAPRRSSPPGRAAPPTSPRSTAGAPSDADRHALVGSGPVEDGLREVERRAREPLGARHLPATEDRVRPESRTAPRRTGDRAPEPLEVVTDQRYSAA